MKRQGLVITKNQLKLIDESLTKQTKELLKKLEIDLAPEEKVIYWRFVIPIINESEESDKWRVEMEKLE